MKSIKNATNASPKLVLTLMLLALFTVLISCKKGNPPGPAEPPGALPVLTTKPVTVNAATGFVESGGVIISTGDLDITERGICWSTTAAPTVANQKAAGKTTTNDFVASPTGLLPNTTYYFRAYATNSKGTAYGNEVTYTAGKDLVVLKATWWGETKTSIGLLQGIRIIISGPGLSAITKVGVCWSTKPNPSMLDSVRATTSMDQPTLHTGVLAAKTKYYARSFAINKTDTVYSDEVTLETPMKVGYLYAGGVILSLNDAKTAGTVVSRSPLDSALPWAPDNKPGVTTGANSPTDGALNTDKIIAAYGTDKSYAAKACRDFRGGGFSDWYLPSTQEMETLDKETSAFHISLNISASTGYDYWSSTESNSANALVQNFELPQKILSAQPKSKLYRVVPMRAFKD